MPKHAVLKTVRRPTPFLIAPPKGGVARGARGQGSHGERDPPMRAPTAPARRPTPFIHDWKSPAGHKPVLVRAPRPPTGAFVVSAAARRTAVPRSARAPPRSLAGGVNALTGKAALEAAVHALIEHAVGPSTQKKYGAAFDSFEYFCGAHGVPALPIDPIVVAAWLYDKCDLVDNAVSSRQWRAHLYGFAHYNRGQPRYDAKGPDAAFYKGVEQALGNLYGRTSIAPPAMTADVLLAIRAAVQPDPTKDVGVWTAWLHLLFGYHLMLRPNEHTGAESLLTAGNVTFGEDPITHVRFVHLTIRTAKGLRRVQDSEGTEMAITRELPGDPLDLYGPLKTYFAMYGLGGRPSQPLFPVTTAKHELTQTYTTAEHLNAILRDFLKRAGISTPYTIRALRSGRRTDLRNGGTPADVVNQLGRWKSEKSSLMYQRANDSIVNRMPATMRSAAM